MSWGSYPVSSCPHPANLTPSVVKVTAIAGEEEAAMWTPMHWRTERGHYIQAHPLQATFSLIASMLLAALVVLALVLSAK